MPTTPVQPVLAAHLFPTLHQKLIAVLRELSDEDWNRPTAAGAWTVKDIAAHLLDGNVRQISFRRDSLAPLPPDEPINSYADLVRFIDGINAVWVRACKRVSPRLLLELHEITGPAAAQVFAGLDPFEPALFGVAWAGEMESANWFDTAREYTERWHHQQQIREAVGAESLATRELLHPVLDTFMRAVPHTYRDVPAPDGTSIVFDITGEAGGSWTLRRDAGQWTLYGGRDEHAACRLTADQDTAWRMMTKGLSREAAAVRITCTGRAEFSSAFVGMLAIMG